MSPHPRHWSTTRSGLLLVVCTLMLAVPRPSLAQVLYGSILGDIKDSSGAYIPGANVVVTNKNTGLTREAVTDQSGRFTFGDLPAGLYSFKVSQQGFKSFEQTALTVTINNVTRMDVTLEI